MFIKFQMMGYWNAWVIHLASCHQALLLHPPTLCQKWAMRFFLHYYPFLKAQYWDMCTARWTWFKFLPYHSVRGKFSSLWACFHHVIKKETAPPSPLADLRHSLFYLSLPQICSSSRPSLTTLAHTKFNNLIVVFAF